MSVISTPVDFEGPTHISLSALVDARHSPIKPFTQMGFNLPLEACMDKFWYAISTTA
jgi:hypothetical protein